MQVGNLSQQPSWQANHLLSQQIPSNSLELTSRHLTTKAKLKLITSGCMNDTFANWRKKKKKIRRQQHRTETVIEGGEPSEPEKTERPVGSVAKSNSFRGLTLEQYFKSRSHSDNKILENSTTLDTTSRPTEEQCDDTRQYLQQTFEIHQTDEQDEDKAKTPDFQGEQNSSVAVAVADCQLQLQKKIRDKWSKKQSSKLKTQSLEDQQQEMRFKSRFPTMQADERMEDDREDMRKVRAVSNLNRADRNVTFTDFFKYESDFKKCKILEKVNKEKDRIQDIKNGEFGYVTKYASKFNIGQTVCKQIMKECRI